MTQNTLWLSKVLLFAFHFQHSHFIKITLKNIFSAFYYFHNLHLFRSIWQRPYSSPCCSSPCCQCSPVPGQFRIIFAQDQCGRRSGHRHGNREIKKEPGNTSKKDRARKSFNSKVQEPILLPELEVNGNFCCFL